MKIEVITLTKELALEFLGENVKNRPNKRQAINRYAADMIAGRWQLNGEALKFDTAGHLIDGQNRCLALVLACELAEQEITVETLVIKDLPRDVQDSMDGQVRRSVADQLAMRGLTKYMKLAAALRTIVLWDDGAILTEHTPSRMRLIQTYETNEDLLRQINDDEIDHLNTSCINASTRVAAKFILLARAGADENAVEEFFYKLGTGTDLSPDSPILALRTRQLNMKTRGVRQRNNLTLLLVLRTWNAWRLGTSLKKVQDRNPQGAIIIPKSISK